MKIKFLTVITSLLVATTFVTSCLDDDNTVIEYSSNASITSFSINDIETPYAAVVDGKDTTLTATVTGTDYKFAIDQSQGLIYNVDSLPVGTDIKKVSLNITADTYLIVVVADPDSIWESTDSLDFTNPVRFKVMAENGSYGQTYTAKINVHQQVPDSLEWRLRGNQFDKTIGAQKALVKNGRLYVFGEQGEQTVVTSTATTDGVEWTEPQSLDLPVKVDYSSVILWNDAFYILAGNSLYRTMDPVAAWEPVDTGTTLSRLVACISSGYNQRLIGITTDNWFLETADGTTWTRSTAMEEGFPETDLAYASYPLQTNEAIDRLVVMGDTSAAEDSVTVAWTRLSTEADWTALAPEVQNKNLCPRLENIGMIHYNGSLYAFGGPVRNVSVAIAPFHCFYQSTDNGVTWSSVSRYLFFPETFGELYEQAEGDYSYAVDENGFLWIIWSRTGEVWRGRVNKLGFKK